MFTSSDILRLVQAVQQGANPAAVALALNAAVQLEDPGELWLLLEQCVCPEHPADWRWWCPSCGPFPGEQVLAHLLPTPPDPRQLTMWKERHGH